MDTQNTQTMSKEGKTQSSSEEQKTSRKLTKEEIREIQRQTLKMHEEADEMEHQALMKFLKTMKPKKNIL